MLYILPIMHFKDSNMSQTVKVKAILLPTIRPSAYLFVGRPCGVHDQIFISQKIKGLLMKGALPSS
jgi:hypothetical protein